jgi:hypothetical protein
MLAAEDGKDYPADSVDFAANRPTCEKLFASLQRLVDLECVQSKIVIAR